MIRTLIEKELKAILLSPKFSAIFAVCSILIVLSIYIGIQDYRASVAHYETTNSLNEQSLRELRFWGGLGTRVSRSPDPMQIFVSGIHNDIGKESPVSPNGSIKLNRSNYADNTIFAVFRSMDLVFIVQIVLSLFAVLFTYDSINGERETGTLKLSFANPIPRSHYIIAKIIGSWFGLVIPLLIPILLGIAMVLFYRIPMSTEHWLRFSLFIGVSVLYFSFFICLGVLLSALTRGSSSSFLYLLVIWVALVLIIPRSGVMIAGKFVEVPTTTEISSRLFQKSRELHDQQNAKMDKRFRNIEATLSELPPDLTPEERQSKRKEMFDELRNKDNEEREITDQEIKKYDNFLNEDWRNRKAVREKLGFTLSRFSPASAYQLAAMELAETGLGLKNNYEDQLRSYQDILNKYRKKKEEESGNQGIMLGSMKEQKPLDLSDMPKFQFVKSDLSKVIQGNIIDVGILAFYILITIAGSFIAFLRYDVR